MATVAGRDDIGRLGRTRPRVFPYTKYLPYETETREKREADVDEMLKHLYIDVAAGDFVSASHWTKEIRRWISLKFDLTKVHRLALVKLYYDLALAPGLDVGHGEQFSSMFMSLIKRRHYLRAGKDLILDWRPLYKEFKFLALPSERSTRGTMGGRRSMRTLTKLCAYAQPFFSPREIPAILDELLPYFSMSFTEQAFAVISLLSLMLPTTAPPSDEAQIQPQYYLPTLFHLWSMVNRSCLVDTRFLDYFSRLARDCLSGDQVQVGPCGLFTVEQSQLIFTAVLRLLHIPVGQASSPYSGSVDLASGNALFVERDARKHPVCHSIARWIIMSLTPKCFEAADKQSVMHQLECLIQGVETFFHPSNYGAWTRPMAQMVFYLTDLFVMRWNREHLGDCEVPVERRLDERLRRRFVLCLRDVVFMGIYSKSGTAMQYSLSSLHCLAYLEPNLILPGALQRIYPAMQGLVEVHRTISSIRALQLLSKVISRTKGFRCHLTTLLGLALPGIDANDLDKTIHSLMFIQLVCYNIPLVDLTKTHMPKTTDSDEDDVELAPTSGAGTQLAADWVTSQVERFEQAGPNLEIDYMSELSPGEEEAILESSTAGFAEFIISLLGRVFTLLQNLPDSSRIRTGSPEENVANTLPAALGPFLASLSPELFDIALEQIAKFVSNHIVHQAKDIMAFICNSLVKISPEKALQRLLPDLMANIRTEINENGAGSSRTTGSEVLPRDRALVWHISLLSMCVVHVGKEVLAFKTELLDLIGFMQKHCKGIPLEHVSNFVHHLLLNLTMTYTTDYKAYEQFELDAGLTCDSWGRTTNPASLNVEWHVPSKEELDFAIEIFQSQVKHSLGRLNELISDKTAVTRDGVGKEWSDEMSRSLLLLKVVIAGASRLFRSDDGTVTPQSAAQGKDCSSKSGDKLGEEETDGVSELGNLDGDKIRRYVTYPAGYPLEIGSPQYDLVHRLRKDAGETLHNVHEYLTKHQEDDVPCFSALCDAYLSWFIDIGLERSSDFLDRLSTLLNVDRYPFKLSGTRKQYPRHLLVRRAYLYHFQRLRYNEHPRAASELDKKLLLDLAHSCTSLYTDIRIKAQHAAESALRSVVGVRAQIISCLLDAFENAIKTVDHPRIKGALYSLLYGANAKAIGKNWKLAPRMIRLYIQVTEEDRPSIQDIVDQTGYTIQSMTKPVQKLVIINENMLDDIWPRDSETSAPDNSKRSVARTKEDALALVGPKKDKLAKQRASVESQKSKLAAELIEEVKQSHWKKASRTAVVAIGLDYRFEHVASDGLIELIAKGVVDPHPALRAMYSTSLNAVYTTLQTRALVEHNYENYLLNKLHDPNEKTIPTERDDPEWTQRYLRTFETPETDAFIDIDHPGWLVWQESMRGYTTDSSPLEFDPVESRVRRKMGSYIDRDWLSKRFGFMKQEPRDRTSDRFRMTNVTIISYALDLISAGLTVATFEDFKELALAVYGDGSDKHQHRAMSETLGALIATSEDFELDLRQQSWDFAFPILRRIFNDHLTPDNHSYWSAFVTFIVGGKDPRRSWPLISWLANFRLDMETNAAFKERSKITLLQIVIGTNGWHFQLHRPIISDFISHLDHPYKGVRELMGSTLALMFRTRHHESHRDVQALLNSQRDASSVGTKPYTATPEFSKLIESVLERLETWRLERPTGTQTSTPYTQASKTVLLWLDSALSAYDCTVLVPFFPGSFMKQLLYMMDIKEDPELQTLAYHVFRHLPNVPHRPKEGEIFASALIKIGQESSSWHQRLRVLINIQVLYFRNLFLMSESQAKELFACVRGMLHDTQHEVRQGAAATLSGMVKCSSSDVRNAIISDLKGYCTDLLVQNPLPRPIKRNGAIRQSSGASTPTPETNKLMLTRHAAVLGLGALVQAFPYTSPPPVWLPEALTTLVSLAASDPGTVGRSVKTILSDFKKTRQDTWHVDSKSFTAEQLEHLEGVLWKSYFA
ncbi:hypothetical protein K470DRAFT_216576 [Piedraia hortae CBS 480.64]|uniref:Proteasome activator subunit 4 n=1 Tax=Piedraia hortae CBS 480.64 TaxID=1314780 RepID=A0A6A7BZF9_9PEZI|nr:hypothetical protein K470DRAFT_216576 [Piedraia hortae CBS 480.64]